MKLYKDGKPYCYDCYQEVRIKRKKKNPLNKMIRKMYKEGVKPTTIAKFKGISTEKVYEILNGKDIE